jgi:structure-specific recognition protein 1
VQITIVPDKKAKRKKDPNAPKKPMSAFFCFQMARRQALKGEAPDLNHKDIIKVSFSLDF